QQSRQRRQRGGARRTAVSRETSGVRSPRSRWFGGRRRFESGRRCDAAATRVPPRGSERRRPRLRQSAQRQAGRGDGQHDRSLALVPGQRRSAEHEQANDDQDPHVGRRLMSISAAQSIDPRVLSALNASTTAKTDTASDLQNHFMTLLVTQLKNQDPLNPMDNSQMTSQLAQINTVSGIQDLNTTLKSINGQINAGQSLQAAALIGKGVLVPGDRVLVGSDGTTTPFGLELGAAADDVQISVTDGSGKVVRSFDLGALDAGTQSFSWDGKLDDGTQAPQGAYTVSIKASSGGQAVDVTGLNYALVTGISTGQNGPLLDLGGITTQVGLGDVRQIL